MRNSEERLSDAIRRLLASGGLLLIPVWFPSPVTAAVVEEENLEINAALLGNFSRREGDSLIGEERLRIDLSAWPESFEGAARLKAELFHDAVDGGIHGELREGYLDYTTGPFDFRLGRQVATWGVGDLLFINDVFPKDWVSFFSGRPLEYLKVGVDGLRTRYSSTPLNAELMIIPSFQEDIMPASGRFEFTSLMAPAAMSNGEDPATTVENTELALRLYRRIMDFDVSAHAYRGFWRSGTFPELSVYGISGQGNSLGGVLSLEAGYYHSRDDLAGDDPFIPNSQFRFLAGYQRQFEEDLTVGVQYYGEIMEDFSAYKMPSQPDLPHKGAIGILPLCAWKNS